MAVDMSDTNNNHNLFTDRMANLSYMKPNDFCRTGCLSQMLQNVSIGSTTDLKDRYCSQTNDLTQTIDYSLSNGFRPKDDWHSGNSPTNGWNGQNESSEVTVDPKPRPGMRAITRREQSDDDLIPKNGHKDWYNTYVDQTNRFATQWNGRTGQRHVHFQKDDNNNSDAEWDQRSQQTFADNSHKPMNGNNSNGSDSDHSDPDWRSNSFPKMKGSIVDSVKQILQPVAQNLHNDSLYMQQQWDHNMAQIKTSLNPIFGDSIWGNSTQNNSIYRFFGSTFDGSQSKIPNLFDSIRKVIPKSIAPNYTWSGQLPRRIRTKTPVYSCKVFLGGIPYDLTDSDLHCTFAQFGHIQIQWPGKDIRSAIEGAAANKAGYVYIIFENYDNVSALLNSCTISYRDLDSGCRWYYNISSRRQKSKEVQVIPFDIGDRFFMKTTFSGQMDHSRTVFVGALHGMLAADGLAKVMDDLFGGVIYAGLDTDKFKYPLGSGRVSFDNNESYLKAVSAAFVEIKSSRFKKKIQIDPYIESESQCVVCRQAIQNPIYCRDEGIYFCHKCWESHHSDPESSNHRPIVKNKSSKA